VNLILSSFVEIGNVSIGIRELVENHQDIPKKIISLSSLENTTEMEFVFKSILPFLLHYNKNLKILSIFKNFCGRTGVSAFKETLSHRGESDSILIKYIILFLQAIFHFLHFLIEHFGLFPVSLSSQGSSFVFSS
jgi:hypothetical protein